MPYIPVTADVFLCNAILPVNSPGDIKIQAVSLQGESALYGSLRLSVQIEKILMPRHPSPVGKVTVNG